MFVKKENHINDVCPSERIKSGRVMSTCPVVSDGNFDHSVKRVSARFLGCEVSIFLPTGINTYVLGDIWRLCKHPNFCVH